NRAGVARDHQVLVGRDHPDRAGAYVGTDDRVMAGVPLEIEADAEMLESGAHFPAHWRGVLADPAREDEGVDPAQDRGERADVLAPLPRCAITARPSVDAPTVATTYSYDRPWKP